MRRRVLAVLIVSAALLTACGTAGSRPQASSGGSGTAVSKRPAPASPSSSKTTSNMQRLHLRAMEVQRTTAPAVGPPAGIVDLSLSSAAQGVAVTGGILIGLNSGGTRTQSPGRVLRTSDGGRSWTAVWQGADADLGWVGRARDGAAWFVVGVTASPHPPGARPLLLRSSDGLHWTALKPQLPSSVAHRDIWGQLRFTFLSAQVGFATVDPQETPMTLDGLLRTTDGGRSWQLISLPGGRSSGGLAFATTSVGVATGVTKKCSALWRTTDGGGAWSMIPHTCGTDGLDTVAFSGRSLGYAGGGRVPKFGGFSVLWKTTDGGRTWHQVYRASGAGPIARLHATGGVLWASSGACTMGQNLPCGGQVMVSRDGGASFRNLPGGGAHLTAVDAQTAMWVTPLFGPLWRTDDGGRQSHPLTSARALQIRQVTALGTSQLALQTNAGVLFSINGGRSFTAAPRAAPGAPPPLLPSLSVGERFTPTGRRLAVTVQAAAGQTKTAQLAVPTGGQDMAPFAFDSGQRGVLVIGGSGCTIGTPASATVYATTDGGGHWRPTGTLGLSAENVSVSGDTIAVVGFENGVCHQALAVSHDGGRHFAVQPLAAALDCNDVQVTHGVIWLLCAPQGKLGMANTALLRSSDGGHSWSGYEVKGFGAGSLAAVSATTAYLTSDGGHLFVTRDGGQTLKELWPQPPPAWR